jgi:ribonuclease Z
MTFEITILGCGAAAPTSRHNPTSQVVNIHDKLYLVDCGEATQMQLRKFKVRFQRINHVFISHLHGDHYLGLMGLISSMHLLGRKSTLHIFGPQGLKELIELNLKVSHTFLEYTLEYHSTETDSKMLIMEDRTIKVYSIPLKHRIDCFGFVFEEKSRPPKIKKEVISKYKLQPSEVVELKRGNSIVSKSGDHVSVSEAAISPPLPRSYAYCSDTCYYEKVIDMIAGTTLLYHESTFLDDMKDRAKSTFHSTARQAAEIASKANVGTLLLGHFSSRYHEDEPFLTEASQVFGNVILANEGKVIPVANIGDAMELGSAPIP